MAGISLWLTDEQIQNLKDGKSVRLTLREEVRREFINEPPRTVNLSGLNARQRAREELRKQDR